MQIIFVTTLFQNSKIRNKKPFAFIKNILHNFVRMKAIPQFLLAAPSSGSGKTTVSVGLMGFLAGKGYKVQPFKCGPDYIDTKFHQKACSRPSVNLDSFFANPNHIRQLYNRYSKDADICIVEGMMGLFDGYSRSRGSAAEIASILGIPVILVVDAKSTAYSLAPLLKGFSDFSKDVKIIGVIFNKVGSAKHRRMLEEVCSDTGLEALGFIPKQNEVENRSRYLGLDFSKMQMVHSASGLIEGNVNVERLLELTSAPLEGPTAEPAVEDKRKVLIASNVESFSFIYQEHLDGWRHKTFFNPEEDFEIPVDTDLLYLPGGYPEKHLDELARCAKTMDSIRRYAKGGGRILAECGGMMYLCRSIIADEGEYQMCGVLPYSVTARKEERKLSLGYRQFSYNGLDLRGHEFHYTKFTDPQPESVADVRDALGGSTGTPVIRIDNTVASYTHLYWGEGDIFKIF